MSFSVRAELAMESRAYWDQKFRYFCGVCWTKIRDRQEIARDLIEAEDEA